MIGVRKPMGARIRPVCMDSETVCREYAGRGGPSVGRQDKPDFRQEREKMKEALLPFVRETVKKQLREEREYYRSRPSMAAKQLEGVLGQGQLVATVTRQVCRQVEEHIRLERIRRGR